MHGTIMIYHATKNDFRKLSHFKIILINKMNIFLL